MQREGALLKSKGRGQMPVDTDRQQWLAFVENRPGGRVWKTGRSLRAGAWMAHRRMRMGMVGSALQRVCS